MQTLTCTSFRAGGEVLLDEITFESANIVGPVLIV